MFCQKCGTEVPDGTKFCPKCGQNLSVVPKTEQTESNATVDSIQSTWDSWNGDQKIIILILACCLGLLILAFIGSFISPDANTNSDMIQAVMFMKFK